MGENTVSFTVKNHATKKDESGYRAGFDIKLTTATGTETIVAAGDETSLTVSSSDPITITKGDFQPKEKAETVTEDQVDSDSQK